MFVTAVSSFFDMPLGAIETMRPFARTEAPADRGQAGPRSGSAYRSAFRQFPSALVPETGHHGFRAAGRRRESVIRVDADQVNEGRMMELRQRQAMSRSPAYLIARLVHEGVGGVLKSRASDRWGDRVPERHQRVLDEYRCGAATQRYRSASSLTLTSGGSLHRSERLPGRSAARSNEIPRRSPQPQHPSEYRSLAVIRNAHTAWLDPVGATLIRAIPCGAAMPGSLETSRQ